MNTKRLKFFFGTAAFAKGIVVLFCLLQLSCLPEPLEVKNVPTVKPEIVVATQMLPEGGLLVLLTKTFGALEASGDSEPEALLAQVAVNDAVVTISGPEGTVPLNFISTGVYGGIGIPFKEGEEYSLTVNSSSLGSVQATATVKPQIKFEKIKAALYYNSDDDSLAEITYSFRDPEGLNWYMVNVQEVELEDIFNNAINPNAFTKLFKDDSFNGGVFSEQFRVFPRDYAPGDSIAVSLSNISEDYYQFLQMRQDNRYSFLEFISEPVNYPSNIIGGRGFFNLNIPDFKFFVLE